ncbi:hypothetical protein NEUTE1DRAFT_51112, partial [Neurospora tetrasperma FGSC 2508]
FIYLNSSLIVALVLLIKKLDRGVRICVNYRGLNNTIIKNEYPILFIKRLLTLSKK